MWTKLFGSSDKHTIATGLWLATTNDLDAIAWANNGKYWDRKCARVTPMQTNYVDHSLLDGLWKSWVDDSKVQWVSMTPVEVMDELRPETMEKYRSWRRQASRYLEEMR